MNFTIFIMSIVLLSVYLIPIYLIRKKNKDIFNPISIISIIHILTTIPYLLMVSFKSNSMSEYVVNHYSFTGYEQTIIKYMIIQCIAYICIIIGISNSKKIKLIKNKSINVVVGYKYTNSILIKSYILLFSVGILAYISLLNSMGGLSYVLNNIHQRTSLLAGKTLLLNIANLTMIAVYCLIYSCKYRYTKFKIVFIWLNIVIVFFMFSAFGGRKSSLYFLLTCIIVWNYAINKINLVNCKLIILIIPLSIYFITMPLFRTPGMVEFYGKNPDILVEDIIENTDTIIKQISYVDHYLLIINYFNNNNLWLGKTYLDLLKAPIPSFIMKNKPPVDDGVYIRSIAEGMYVEPNTPFNELYPSSWPPETLGISYMNFGIAGVVVYMMILGFIYSKAYSYMLKNKSLFSIYLYSIIITNFHLSNLRIIQTSISIFTTGFLFSVLFGFKIIRIYKHR